MDKISKAVGNLPTSITCFLLEIGTGKAKTTEKIGALLKSTRPFSILMSYDSYFGLPTQFAENTKKMRDNLLDANVMLFNMAQGQFLESNSTKFHIIFAHNGIDAVPFKKFLVDGGKIVVV